MAAAAPTFNDVTVEDLKKYQDLQNPNIFYFTQDEAKEFLKEHPYKKFIIKQNNYLPEKPEWKFAFYLLMGDVEVIIEFDILEVKLEDWIEKDNPCEFVKQNRSAIFNQEVSEIIALAKAEAAANRAASRFHKGYYTRKGTTAEKLGLSPTGFGKKTVNWGLLHKYNLEKKSSRLQHLQRLGGRRVKHYTRAHKKSRHTRGHKKSRRTHHKTKHHRK